MSAARAGEKNVLRDGLLGKSKVDPELKELADKYTHLKKHLVNFNKKHEIYPELVEKPETHSISEIKQANAIYRTEGPLFAHVYAKSGETNRYLVVEPTFDEEELELYQNIREKVVEHANEFPAVEKEEEYEKRLEEIYDRIVDEGVGEEGILDKIRNNTKEFQLPTEKYEKILYKLKRDIAGLGPLEPLLKDMTNEDIHIVGPNKVYVFNKLFRLMRTNIKFGSEEEYKELLNILAKRVGDRVSDKNPILDSVLPDSSRLNIIYPDDVSVQGPSVTIRQFEETPPSIFEIVKWGTMSAELAAYLWLCLESNVSGTIAGETAAGKTTTLNAISAFIRGGSKIYTAEETPELKIPHKAWQRLIARESSSESSGEVSLFDLVKSSLRSRPDYILIGEVRGKEAFNVFQAMQTGHPTLFTFHAGNIVALIHRFNGDPLNVPETFFGNLNICVFQNFIKTENKELRRVTEVREIEGYSEEAGGILTRQAFKRDPAKDKLSFTGENNSYILETKVATTLGYEDPRNIYEEIDKRAWIIKKAITKNILGYHEVVDLIRAYQQEGEEGLPFSL